VKFKPFRQLAERFFYFWRFEMADNSTVMGAYLRGLREFSRATLLEAGREVGVSCATMSNYERGFGKFSDQQIERLEAYYRRRISERLGRIVKSL